jgi:hypothetical protein
MFRVAISVAVDKADFVRECGNKCVAKDSELSGNTLFISAET